MRPKQLLLAAPLFAALGDPTRLALVSRLSAGGPLTITSLTEDTNVTRQAVTKHLRLLESVGLVTSAKQGRETRFALDPRKIEEATAHLAAISRQWDAALDRLKAFVERPA
jgi:DNA-binding transcriptional ArsR family regulator